MGAPVHCWSEAGVLYFRVVALWAVMPDACEVVMGDLPAIG
jgi:hypothetical protein